MIIGSNKPNSNKFKNFNPNKQNISAFTKDLNDFVHTNPNDTKEMKAKAIAMLKSRLDNKTITVEQFNKELQKIGKN